MTVAHPACRPAETVPPTRGDFALAVTKWDVGKDPRFFLDVWEALGTRFPLTVAGFFVPTTLRDRLAREVERRGLQDHVRILGPLSEEELLNLYRTARVLVHPIREAFGMTALEAAAHGCPFVIPAGSGVHEVIPPDRPELAPQEGDVTSFAHAVKPFLEDAQFAAECGKTAWARCRPNTWERHARTLETAFTNALEASNK